MGMYEKILNEKRYTTVVGTINDHIAHVRQIFPKLFEGKNFNIYMQVAVKDIATFLNEKKITELQCTETWGKLPMGKGTMTRNAFVEVVEKVLQTAVSSLEPLEPTRPTVSSYATLVTDGKVAIVNDNLARKLDTFTKGKIASVFDYGNNYKGHGPTRNLGVGVLHAHVGGGDGIAFSWTGDVLTIHGYGTKSDSAPSGSSGYKWITN